MKIVDITAREILDSKDEPTIEVEVTLENGTKALGQVPSGASTGANEAVELRDNDSGRYDGKGVLAAVSNVKGPIKKLLVGQDVKDQEKIDKLMIELDGTENKAKLGANAIIGVSMAVVRAAARAQKIPLYQYFGQLSENHDFFLPQPQILMLEGGKHGNWAIDIQEYMIIPQKEKFESFAETLETGTEIFHTLEKILSEKGYSIGTGYEGAFCPKEIKSNEEGFELVIQAVEKAGYKMPEQIVLGIDAAASEFFENNKYVFKSEKNLSLNPREWTQKIISWTKKYPIWSLEDMHHEEAWDEWVYLTSKLGSHTPEALREYPHTIRYGAQHLRGVKLVGDDFLTTNVKRIQKAIKMKACNAVIIKPNQVGTITETLEAIKLAHSAGFTAIVSHRGGETNDDLIADLVVGTTASQCKFGAPIRGERLAKYNRLLRIEEKLLKSSKDNNSLVK